MNYYSQTTNGFYNSAIHGNNIPADAREITPAKYAQLLQEQATGRVITVNELGQPVTVAQEITTNDLIRDAQALRDSHINSPITVLGVQWQIDKASRDNMSEAIDYATRTNQLAASRLWILANNDPRATTALDLQAVKDAYVQRMDDTFIAYGLWHGGDKTTPFTLEEN
jgi:hypothetical protein